MARPCKVTQQNCAAKILCELAGDFAPGCCWGILLSGVAFRFCSAVFQRGIEQSRCTADL